MTTHYRFDPGQSRFTVQAFATGLLSFAGHSPIFSVRDFQGGLDFDPESTGALTMELAVRADGLELVGNFSASDRGEIESRMRRDVLQTAAFPEISYRAAEAAVSPFAAGRYRLRVGGKLTLCGVTRPQAVDAELQVGEDAARVLGETTLRMSDYRIRPVTALAGTIRLKDELTLLFDLIGLREAT